MLYYFDINTWIVTTVSGVSDTLTRRAMLRLQLVIIIINFRSKIRDRYISMKFPFKPESSEKMVKTSNLSCKNKTNKKIDVKQ